MQQKWPNIIFSLSSGEHKKRFTAASRQIIFFPAKCGQAAAVVLKKSNYERLLFWLIRNIFGPLFRNNLPKITSFSKTNLLPNIRTLELIFWGGALASRYVRSI